MWNQFATETSAKGGPGSILGPGGAAGGWHPTVLYLVGLVLLELVVLALVSRLLLK